jgi:hypothetical protein
MRRYHQETFSFESTKCSKTTNELQTDKPFLSWRPQYGYLVAACCADWSTGATLKSIFHRHAGVDSIDQQLYEQRFVAC